MENNNNQNTNPRSVIKVTATPRIVSVNVAAGAENAAVVSGAEIENEPMSSSPKPKADHLNSTDLDSTRPINYRNGKKIEPFLFSFNNYYKHREKLPQHYHPLVQYLDKTELKYHNDNLYEDSPIGFPTRAQILREKVYRLPIIKSTPVDKARYRRKVEERQQNIIIARKKFDFKTYDNHSSHYFLTGARFNRDTVDSKMLNKYGVFVNKRNPDSVYIKSAQKAVSSFNEDLSKMKSFSALHSNRPENEVYESKSVQCSPYHNE